MISNSSSIQDFPNCHHIPYFLLLLFSWEDVSQLVIDCQLGSIISEKELPTNMNRTQ